MPQLHISSSSFQLISSLSECTDLRVGDVLHIRALDALTGRIGTFQIQIIAFKNGVVNPEQVIYQFLQNKFRFFDSDRKTATHVRNGTMATSGLSATHLPCFIEPEHPCRAMRINHDYSFEDIGGKRTSVYVRGIISIQKCARPEHWVPPTDRIARYLKTVKRQKPPRRKDWWITPSASRSYAT